MKGCKDSKENTIKNVVINVVAYAFRQKHQTCSVDTAVMIDNWFQTKYYTLLEYWSCFKLTFLYFSDGPYQVSTIFAVPTFADNNLAPPHDS